MKSKSLNCLNKSKKRQSCLYVSICASLLSLVFYSNVFSAEKPPLPPPSGLPKSLPPLPGGFIPKTPASSPSNKDGVYIQPAQPVVEPKKEYTALEIMSEEADRLSQAAKPMFDVRIITTDSDEYNNGVKSGQIDIRGAYALNSGMYGVYVKNMSNARCLVLLNKNMLPALQTSWIDPSNRMGQPRAGAAFLVGREVGRCLDMVDRIGKINSRLSWSGNDLNWLGLQQSAAKRAYGDPMAKDAYLQNPVKIMSDKAYIQYQERGLDIFAIYWVAKLGAEKQILDAFCTNRRISGTDTSSDISPATCSAAASSGEVLGLVRMDTIWDAARKKQVYIGVSGDALSGGSEKMEVNSNEPAYWRVTPRGVVPFDANGNEIIMPNQQLNGGPKKFEDLPRM